MALLTLGMSGVQKISNNKFSLFNIKLSLIKKSILQVDYVLVLSDINGHWYLRVVPQKFMLQFCTSQGKKKKKNEMGKITLHIWITVYWWIKKKSWTYKINAEEEA